ncbi:MAG: cytochrome P450 [Phototrophicaceae bacterium]
MQFNSEKNEWTVTGYTEAKHLLKGPVVQSGFGAKDQRDSLLVPSPSLPALDGDEHRDKRREVGKLFTPKASETYNEFIQLIVLEKLNAALNTDSKIFDYKHLATEIAHDVASEVVGLEHNPGLVDRYLHVAQHHDVKMGWSFETIRNAYDTMSSLFQFWVLDVRPAIKVNRNQSNHNLISYMLRAGYDSFTILIDTIAFGLAGVLTTRELMVSVLLECLRTHEYYELMRSDDFEARKRFVLEILRLNPVTAHLYREAYEDISISLPDAEYVVQAGQSLCFDIKAINRDPRVYPVNPDGIDITRDTSKMEWSMLAFGYAHHRCPGEHMAIIETDLLLHHLLQNTVTLVSEPYHSYQVESMTNEINNIFVEVELSSQMTQQKDDLLTV